MMKEHGSAAIHLQVKVALIGVVVGTEEEFHTTVCIYRVLVIAVHGQDIPVFHPEYDINSQIVIGDLGLRKGEMLRPVTHIMVQLQRLDPRPGSFVPYSIDIRRLAQPAYLISGAFFLNNL
jgi:hypothetical protein